MAAHLQLAGSSSEAPPDCDSSSEAQIRVVLADDRAAVRRSLRMLLDGEENVQVVAEAGDIATVLLAVRGETPNVLVLDLQMPNGSSIEMIRSLREQAPDTEVVVLTMEASPVFAQQALDAGAIGFVLKEHSDLDLYEAVRCASAGEEYVSPQVAAGLDALRCAKGQDGLSPREIEVLRLTALGYTGSEIASKLHLSRRTVESHRATIHRKLGLASRAELVRYALGRKLIKA
jgi:two-component system response regulator NreC